jgi:hypothetical protein
VCHPEDVRWFEDERILPGLPRTVGPGVVTSGLQVIPHEALPPGLALLDSPDIDSVVEANRTLASQLLAAADSWLFVTTAARYADAVPWDMLHAARDRGTALSLVLNRVPAGAEAEIAPHLEHMLAEQGLAGTPLLVAPEAPLEDGRLPAAALAPVRRWLDALAADAESRVDLVRRTLAGALDSLPARVAEVRRALDAQVAVADTLADSVDRAYDEALDEVDQTLRSGTLLRGEVLARWHEVVGTGDLMRSLETRIGWLRDRVRSIVTGAPQAETELKAAVQSSVDALVHVAADRAAERAAATWRQDPAGRRLLEGATRLDAASTELAERTASAVRSWQGQVFDLVRAEGADKRTTARLASYGVNAAGLAVMLVTFAGTGGLTGAEVAVAGGTSALAQKVLEAIFGDQAIRALAARAREDLLARVRVLLRAERDRYRALLDPVAPDPDGLDRLRAAMGAVERAR